MDPALLLDTLSTEDMEMWHSYNFFTDENQTNNNQNDSLKDEIKEENIDMDSCFSSICPNDLLNNISEYNSDCSIKLNAQLDSNNFSCSSVSQSPNSHASELMQIQNYNILESNNYNDNNNNINNNNVYSNEYLSNNSYDILSTSVSSVSSVVSSAIPSPSLSITNRPNDYVVNNNLQTYQSNVINRKQIEPADAFQMQTNSVMIITSPSNVNIDNNQILIVNNNNETLTTEHSNINNSNNEIITNTILPPSPPSSTGSDTESNHSFTIKPTLNTSSNTDNSRPVTSIKQKDLLTSINSNKIIKSSAKHINQSKNTTVIRQIRHQPYSTIKPANFSNSNNKLKACSAIVKQNANQTSVNSSSNNCASDEDCWPFFMQFKCRFIFN